MATIVAAVGGGDWNTGTSWVGGTAPTAADDAQVPLAAGNMSIGAGAVCRSADFSTYTGTLSGTGTLTIGDATAGLSSIALKLVAGMTVTGPPVFSFISTSATVQTIDFATKNTGNVTFNPASNGSWQLTGAWGTSGISTSQITTLTRGTLDLNGQTCFWGTFVNNSGNVRTLTCGASVVTMVGGGNTCAQSTTNLTFNSNTSEFICTNTNFNWNGGGTWNKVTFTPAAAATWGISTTFTCATLTLNQPASKTGSFSLTVNIVVTSALNLTGNSSVNRLFITSNSPATPRTLTTTGATVTASNTDFQDITLSTSKDFSGQTDIGDCGGNSGITFPTAVSQTWNGTSGGNWSANAWTTRVPLPQDDVVMNAAFSAGQTVTVDMPRLGKSIDWTGATGSPTWSLSLSGSGQSIFGSVTLISGMTLSGTQALVFAGRSTFSITSAGKQYLCQIQIIAPTGTYTLQDAFSTTQNLSLTHGGFNSNGFNVTYLTFISNGSTTRALTMGTSTWSSISTAATTVWSLTNTGITFSGASSTIIVTVTSANTRTFAGAGLTYGTLTYTLAGSTGELDITGANTFNTINFSDVTNARSLKFTAATTTTVTTFNVNGTSGKLMTVASITGPAFTMTSAAQQSCDFLNLTNSVVDATPKWYAGANSTDNGGNTNWIFTAPPAATASSGYRTLLGVGI